MAFKWDIPIFINWLNIVSNILLFLNLFICLFQIPIEFRKVFSIEKSQISGNNDFNGCFFPLFLLTQLLYFVQRWTDDLFVEQLLSCIYQINLNIWIAINWRKYSYEQPLIEDEFKGFPLQFKKNNRVKTNQFYIKVQIKTEIFINKNIRIMYTIQMHGYISYSYVLRWRHNYMFCSISFI